MVVVVVVGGDERLVSRQYDSAGRRPIDAFPLISIIVFFSK